MPPIWLISSIASRIPLRMLTPSAPEPPVNGPDTPIRIADAGPMSAWTGGTHSPAAIPKTASISQKNLLMERPDIRINSKQGKQ
jgi:hypothetical protein